MSVAGEATDKVVGWFGETVEKLVAGKPILGSNKAINSIFGVPEMLAKGIKNGNWDDALKSTFQQGGKTDWGKVAGSYIGVAAAGRVLSGGGIYKDRNGNTNLIGVPFV
jgi:hypothetical protein